MKNNNVDVERLKAATSKIANISYILQLENDFINLVPGPGNIEKDELLIKYHYLDKALSNIFELNQGLMDDLGNLCITIDEEIEVIENTKIAD